MDKEDMIEMLWEKSNHGTEEIDVRMIWNAAITKVLDSAEWPDSIALSDVRNLLVELK